MTGHSDEADGDRISTHKENVRDLLNRFDDVMASAAANGWDSRIVSQLQIMRDTAERFDEAMLAAAATAVPDGPGLDTVLAGSLSVTVDIPVLRPELVTDSALARIRDALKLINSELNNYVSNGNTVHLTALDTGLQNLYQVNGHCFGYWRLGNDPSRAGKIKRLSLQLGIPDTGALPGSYPVLRLLVDGIEGLAVVRGRTYSGFPPAEILGPDSPLLPAQPARHVPLYVETGGGPAAGCIAALIHTLGDYIAWNDFRVFNTVYAPAMQPDPLDGSPFGVPQLFDSGQYRAEVQRASTDRAWEAEPWQTALLLDAYLRADPRPLGGAWVLGKAEPHAEDTGAFTVTVWDDHHEHGLIVDLAADPGTPEHRARQMADFLITTPQDQWPSARPTQQGTSS